MRTILFCLTLPLVLLGSCTKEEITFQSNDLKISIKTGNEWLHKYPLPLGFSKKNAPQYAVWLTDMDTNYLCTIFCTHKIAHEAWVANGGNRRKESLPFWCHNRGIKYPDGLYLPTKKQPLTDGISGATPTGDHFIKLVPSGNSRFLIFAEFNHSVDFNQFYRKDTPDTCFFYSGGEGGSGQPSLVFCAAIDLSSTSNRWELHLEGHACPNGSNGNIYKNLETITTALAIVHSIIVERK